MSDRQTVVYTVRPFKPVGVHCPTRQRAGPGSRRSCCGEGFAEGKPVDVSSTLMVGTESQGLFFFSMEEDGLGSGPFSTLGYISGENWAREARRGDTLPQ